MTAQPLVALIVENDPVQASALVKLLEADDGFVLDVARSLADARRLLLDFVPDVVILDLGLPDGNGVEAVEAIRKEVPGASLVVLTGEQDQETARQALLAGAQDYLIKGHTPMLARAVRQAVERKRAQDEQLASRIERPLVRAILHEMLQRARLSSSELREVGRFVVGQVDAPYLEMFLRAFTSMGLGGSLRCDLAQGGRYVFTAADLLERRKASSVTTCDLTLGFLCGAVARVEHGRETLGSELTCQSRGDAYCTFVVQARGSLKAGTQA